MNFWLLSAVYIAGILSPITLWWIICIVHDYIWEPIYYKFFYQSAIRKCFGEDTKAFRDRQKLVKMINETRI